MIAKITDDKTIKVFDTNQFDISAILHSGQVFRYDSTKNGWRVFAGENYADISSDGECVIIRTDKTKFFFNYFDLDRDYAPVTASLSRHAQLADALEFGQGIRILRGEFVETVISFIISANNNIKRFTKTLNILCEKHGQKLDCGGFGFPSLLALSKLTEQNFAQFGCGYRSKYLVRTINAMMSPDFDFQKLSEFTNEQLNKKLRELSGVGDKVARCIMLFCFNRLSVAPVDTWIAKAYQKIFVDEPKGNLSSKKMAEKFETHFGQYAGIVQQYLFYFFQHLRKDL